MSEINPKLFEQPYDEFTRHLNIPDNERIIFSANFGMGKTSFLKWYFDTDEIKKKYNSIHLFPVNYSVASNEDVFRYLKYDIILEMIQQQYQVEDAIDSVLITLPSFLKLNAHKVLASLINIIPIVGRDIVQTFEKLDSLKESFFKYHDEMISQQDDSRQLLNYINRIELIEGTIFENDIVTKVIENVIIKNKELKQAQETILIIDDLDRIDPEHIFRLLNVFAAHFDRKNKGNKFGFDKVIFVCDIHNIREIFRARFGLKVDFNGYINKFFSTKVFKFDHTLYYSRFIKDRLYKAISINTTYADERSPIFTYGGLAKPYLDYYIEIFLRNKLLDLRSVIKWGNMHLHYKNSYETRNGKYLSIHNNPTILVLKFLHDTIGDVYGLNEVIYSLNDIDDLGLQDSERNVMCGDLLLLMNFNTENNNIEWYLMNIKLMFYFNGMHRDRKLEKVVNEENKEISLTDAHFVELLLETIKFMDKENVF